MTLVPWTRQDLSPTQFRSLRDELDEFFHPLFEQLPGHAGRTFMPLVNIKDDDKYVTVTADVPGMDKKDIDIKVNGSTLTLRGERKEEKEEKGGNGDGWWRKESSYGSFMRRVPLPCDVEAAKTEATLANGVLTIRLAKAEGAKTTPIQIK